MRILLSFFIRALLFIMSGFRSRTRQKCLSSEMPSRRKGCLDERATPRAHRRTRTRTHTRRARARAYTTRTTNYTHARTHTHAHKIHTHTHTPLLRACDSLKRDGRKSFTYLEQPGTADDDRTPYFVCGIRHARSPTITGRRCLRRQRGENRRRRVEVPSSFSPAPRSSTFNDAFPNSVGEHLSSRLD